MIHCTVVGEAQDANVWLGTGGGEGKSLSRDQQGTGERSVEGIVCTAGGGPEVALGQQSSEQTRTCTHELGPVLQQLR